MIKNLFCCNCTQTQHSLSPSNGVVEERLVNGIKGDYWNILICGWNSFGDIHLIINQIWLRVVFPSNRKISHPTIKDKKVTHSNQSPNL